MDFFDKTKTTCVYRSMKCPRCLNEDSAYFYHVDPESKNEEVDAAGLIEGLNQIGFKDLVKAEDVAGKSRADVIDLVDQKAWDYYQTKIEPVKEQIKPLEKEMSLRTIDRACLSDSKTGLNRTAVMPSFLKCGIQSLTRRMRCADTWSFSLGAPQNPNGYI